MNIIEKIEQERDYIVSRRRYFHANPEPSCQEEKTTAQIKADLLEIGITDIYEFKNCHGLMATIHGGATKTASADKVLALRADIDGLVGRENTGLPFSATGEFMHACGHDSHMAMVLGAGKVLFENRDKLAGDVRLIFQPAEEGSLGAKWILEEGAMEGVTALYGGHIWSELDAPLIDITPGNRMASCDNFTIEVFGKAAHAAMPHKGIDTIAISASMISSIQQFASRINDPLDPVVVTIGTIQGGTRWGTIADHTVMEGTIRSYHGDGYYREPLRKIVEGTAEALGGKAEIRYELRSLPLINRSEELVSLARDCAAELYGKESLAHMKETMAAEDFGTLGGDTPYVYVFLGNHNEEKGTIYPNHSEKFDIDEDMMIKGCTLMTQFALKYLK